MGCTSGCRRVLIIEPEGAIREALCEALRMDEMTFCAARTCGEARARLDAGCKPHVIVLDISSPPGCGTEFFEFVRSEERIRDLPLLVTTALPRDKVPATASAVLQKPFGVDDFLQIVKQLVDRAEARHAAYGAAGL